MNGKILNLKRAYTKIEDYFISTTTPKCVVYITIDELTHKKFIWFVVFSLCSIDLDFKIKKVFNKMNKKNLFIVESFIGGFLCF